jgi:hypothetical protein
MIVITPPRSPRTNSPVSVEKALDNTFFVMGAPSHCVSPKIVMFDNLASGESVNESITDPDGPW